MMFMELKKTTRELDKEIVSSDLINLDAIDRVMPGKDCIYISFKGAQSHKYDMTFDDFKRLLITAGMPRGLPPVETKAEVTPKAVKKTAKKK